LKALGVEGSAIGLVLKNGDVNENIESAKKLKKSEMNNHSIELEVRRKSIPN
jgi:hypothetical protein